jgi:acetyl-CoA carboxylase carboxyltransferase component
MGGEQAAQVLLQIEKASFKKRGEELDQKSENELLNKIINRYNKQTTPEYAAARMWVDEIIKPTDTRKWISAGIELANNNPIERFNVGVIQT